MLIEQPQNSASELEEEAVPVAPATWQDIVRQHITGPVFSLAFHIFLLVLLGTIIVIAPNAGKDDIDPVQLTELEPVLPPPEEEPTPSDMTVIDTSSPSLDRYDANNQQLEEVGVTDAEMMTDIEIPTPLTVPDSNSSLKLQGVLPFGRKGGGDMGDGGEGDGRGNTKGMLQGVFYDLKQTRSRQTSKEFAGVPRAPTPTEQDPNPKNWVLGRVPPTLEIMHSFVNGSWQREYDNAGRVHYPALDKYYCSPTRLWTSCFYTDEIDAELAPKYYECDNVVKVPGAWVCIYSGNVVAPFSGKFRFLGTADDLILVRFNNEIVLDYGYASFSAASFFYTARRWFPGGRTEIDTSMIPDGVSELEKLKKSSALSYGKWSWRRKSPLYSKHPLEVYSSSDGDTVPAHSLAKGSVITVKEGNVYPIEIMISEIPGGSYYQALFIEQLDDKGMPLDPNPQEYILFRTTIDLPEQASDEERMRPQPAPGGGAMPGGMPGMPGGMPGMPGGMPGMPGGMPGGMMPGGDMPQSRKYYLPKFKPYGPIFRVVRSTTSSGGGGSGSGSSGILGNRTQPRTARVNENDDDLSL